MLVVDFWWCFLCQVAVQIQCSVFRPEVDIGQGVVRIAMEVCRLVVEGLFLASEVACCRTGLDREIIQGCPYGDCLYVCVCA